MPRPTPYVHCAFYTPRISYDGSKTVIWACRGSLPPVVHGVYQGWCGRVGTGRGVLGWVPGGCYTGYYPPSLQIGIARAQPASRLVLPGPNQPQGHARRHSRPAARALRTPAPRGQIGRDSTVNILKLVINPECHLKKVHEACHTPYLKNRSHCHDLEFPGFS